MANGSTRLAKLTRPRLHAPVPRERLFRRLDELRAHPVVWIAGPPGAGKTTLVASYLDAARLQALWMQIDAGDSDPAAFFLYLRQAVGAIEGRRARPLPLLTAEYLADVPGFARRFLRNAFARLPPQTLVVLDNYHELAPDSPVHAALAAALAEIPSEANLIVSSRAEPPPAFAEARLNATIGLLGWSDLKLTASEAETVARERGVADTSVASKLHAQTDGWFAGLALLLEQARSGESIRGAVRADALEIVFDFFSQVIFDRAPQNLRGTLLLASLLPRLPVALLEQLGGLERAAEDLDALFRRHLFVERSNDAVPTYQFHALFRAFLRHRAIIALPSDVQRRFLAKASAAFEGAGAWDEAFELSLAGADIASGERILLAAAPSLLAQGRWRTLLDWVRALDSPQGTRSPWVSYWLGRATVAEDRLAARAILTDAYESFRTLGDTTGEILCAVAVMEAIHFRYRDFLAMDVWIDRIAALVERGDYAFSAEDELRVHSALLVATTYRMPEHRVLPVALERVKALLPRVQDVNLIVTVASVLHGYENTTVDLSAAELATRIARPLLGSSELTAQTLGFYLSMEGYTAYMHGRYDVALSTLAEAEAAVAGLGLHEVECNVEVWRALTQRRAGLLDEAERTLLRIEAADGTSTIPFAPRQFVRACIAFDRGRISEAIKAVIDANEVTLAGGQYVGRLLVGIVSANILIGSGQHALAESYLQRLRSLVTGPITDHYLGAIELNAAWLAHRTNRTNERNIRLREALRRARDLKARERIRWYPNALAELLPLAIEHGIEDEVACDLVRAFGIAPTDLASEAWPWRMRVRTLGPFSIEINGTPLGYGRKAPKRTVSLLVAIIAFGGHAVPEDRLADALWPGEDADAAKRSLAAALHRLRALIQCNDVIRASGGALTLDRQLCWVDALAVEDLSPDPGEDARVLELHRGSFLQSEHSEPWALPMRERLRARFIRAVERTGRSLEDAGEFQSAIELYERGLDTDPLIEGFHRGLMRSWLGLGRPAESASAYRRLQRTLAVALGSQPTPESRALMERATRIE